MILVPTDFSTLSVQAILAARRLAKIHNKKILLLNSFQVPPSTSTSVADISMLLSEQSIKGLGELIKKYFEPTDDVESYSFYGSLVNGFEKVNKLYDIDFALMSTSGGEGVFNTLFGSQTTSVLSVNSFPLIVLPDGAHSFSVKRIAIASDLSIEINYPQLSFVKKYFENQVEVYNIVSVFESSDDFSIKDVVKQQIEINLGIEKVNFVLLESKDVFSRVNQYLNETSNDLLVLFEKQYGFIDGVFHKSFTKQMLLTSHIPIVVLPSI
jgi:nucleotide-binding universal stress UspA family protein